MDIVPQNSFLDVKLTGNGSDLRDIIHAQVGTSSPLTPLEPKAQLRVVRYLHKRLVLSQNGTRLVGDVKSIQFLPSDQKGLALFELKARYKRDPLLATAPLQLRTSLFSYLPLPCLVISLGSQQVTLVSRDAETSFAPETTIVTPAQSGWSYFLLGFVRFSQGLQQVTFLLALLLTCVALQWRQRLAISAGFLMAFGLAFSLAMLGVLSIPVLAWALGIVFSLIYIGFENLPLKPTGGQSSRWPRLLVGALVCGFVFGGFAASQQAAFDLPEEAVGLCLLAFVLGTAAILLLAGVVVWPIADFWHRKLKQRAESGVKSSSRWMLPLSRAVAVGCYLLLSLVAGLNLASAMQAKTRVQLPPAQAVNSPATKTAATTGSYQTIEEMTLVHTIFTQVAFASMPCNPVAGLPTKWTIKVRYKEDNEPVEEFALMHAKLLHLIVASSDLSWYTHVHPVYQGDGVFTISVLLPHAGRYRFYADYMPKGQTEHEVVLHEFKVSGSNALPAVPQLVPAKLKGIWLTQQFKAAPEGLPDVGNGPHYEVALMPMPSVIKAGVPLMLHYQVRDAQGKPLTDLEPYMGAMGHCVVLNAEPQTYLHVHPMSEGMNHASMMNMTLSQMLTMNMSSEKLLADNVRGGPNIMFHTFFPKAGNYKVWAQFQRGGKIITSSFVLKVQ